MTLRPLDTPPQEFRPAAPLSRRPRRTRLLLDLGGLLALLVACVAIAVALVEFVGIP